MGPESELAGPASVTHSLLWLCASGRKQIAILFFALAAAVLASAQAQDWTRSGVGAVQCVASLSKSSESVIVGSAKGVVARLSLQTGADGKASRTLWSLAIHFASPVLSLNTR